MSVKYKRCATEDPDSTSVAIDFSSPFQFSSGTYNSYASEADYKSIFSYNHQRRNQNFEPYTGPPSLLTRICSILVTFLCYVLVFLTAPISLWFCIKVVKQNEKAVIFRLGRLQPIRGPGVMLVLPLVERWAIVDIKTRAFSVPPQQLLTTDGAVVEAGAEVYFRITDVLQCVANVQDLDHSNRTIAKTCLLNELSKRSRAEVEADKVTLNTILQADISAMTTNWGVEIERVEMSPPRVLHAATGNSGPDLGALTSLIPGLNKSMVCPPDGANPIQQMHMAAMQKAGLAVGGGAGLGAVAPPVVPAAEAGASGSSGQAAVPMTIPNEIDPRRLISAVEKCVNESIIRSFDSLYRFEVDGPMGGVFYIDFKSAEFSCGEGEGPGGEADVTLSLSAQDMTLIFTGQLKAFQAYMAGRLRVSGDLNAAMRLEELMSKLTGKVQQ